jgi:hypothetical protein
MGEIVPAILERLSQLTPDDNRLDMMADSSFLSPQKRQYYVNYWAYVRRVRIGYRGAGHFPQSSGPIQGLYCSVVPSRLEPIYRLWFAL